MPPPLLFDLSQIDINAKPLYDRGMVEKVSHLLTVEEVK